MGVRKMLLIDRWLGVPALPRVVVPALVVRGPAPRRRFYPPSRRILFVKLAEQGSTVLAYSALREATRRVGRGNVYMMVFDNNRFILDALGVIPPENVFPLRYHSLPALVRAALAAVWRVRRLHVGRRHWTWNFSRVPPRCSPCSVARPCGWGSTLTSAKGPLPRAPPDPPRALQPARAHHDGVRHARPRAGPTAGSVPPGSTSSWTRPIPGCPVFQPAAAEIAEVRALFGGPHVRPGRARPRCSSCSTRNASDLVSPAPLATRPLRGTGRPSAQSVSRGARCLHGRNGGGRPGAGARPAGGQPAVLFPGGSDHVATTARALHPGRRARDQRQRPGPISPR